MANKAGASNNKAAANPSLSSSCMPHVKFILIPISEATHGHGTHTAAAVWKDYLIDFLHETEKQETEKK